jgi:hypothetical protein
MTLDGSMVDLVVDGSRSVEKEEAVGWREIDRALRRIARSEGRLEAEKGRWMLAARDAAVHRQFGFATFPEYIEHVFGYGPRDTRDRLRVAEALLDLPRTSAVFAAGHLPYRAVRALAGVLKPENEEIWLERVKGRTVREIESMVRGRRPGDHPDDPADPDLRTFALRFELAPENLALFRDARQEVVRKAGHVLSDEDVLAAMCRAALSHGPDTGTRTEQRPPYQVFVTVCERCERGWQEGAGEAIAVGPAVIARATCDADVVRRTADGRSSKSRTIPKSIYRLVMRRDHHRCIVPGCRNSEHLEVHHLQHRARGGDNQPDNLAVLCSGHHSALHEGRLVIRGKPGAFQFEHEDGRAWGTPPPEPAPKTSPAPSLIDDLRVGLRGLGIKGRDVTAVIQRAATHVSHDAPLEVWFREALRQYRSILGP